MNPHGIRTKRERQKFDKDRRRWKHADKNGDEKVTKHEFKYFLFPQLSPDSGAVTIPEAFADLDTDFDGRITFDEFLAVYQVSQDWDDQVQRTHHTTYTAQYPTRRIYFRILRKSRYIIRTP